MAKKNTQNLLRKIFQIQFLAVTEHTEQAKDHHWISRDELHRIDTPFMQNINFEI